jgi:chromate transporter
VLPMLLGDLVKQNCDDSIPPICTDDPERSWVTTTQFYAGLALVQAMPGPLFNFSAYLGAIIAINAGYFWVTGAAVAWLGLFGPGVTLMFAVLPFWQRFRTWQTYRRALPGMNAASVGLILASVFRMTFDVHGISTFPTASLCIGLLAFVAVDGLSIFEPFVVVAGIGAGIASWWAQLH